MLPLTDLFESLPKRYPAVLRCMVVVNVKVAFAFQHQIPSCMLSESADHMV
jgi:hypothetical protein